MAYTSRSDALFLLPDDNYDNTVVLFDPIPALPLVLEQPEKPGVLFWTITGTTRFYSLDEGVRTYRKIQDVLDTNRQQERIGFIDITQQMSELLCTNGYNINDEILGKINTILRETGTLDTNKVIPRFPNLIIKHT